MSVKQEFHALIDQIEDEEALKAFMELIKSLSYKKGNLIDELSESQKEALFMSYDESFVKTNLVSHEAMKNKHEKWLRK